MAKILNYIVVNDVILVKPTKFEREVQTQEEIEALKPPLAELYGLAEKNKEVEEHNKLFDSTKSKYQVLFTVANAPGENLQP
jgi:hypothetical protein